MLTCAIPMTSSCAKGKLDTPDACFTQTMKDIEGDLSALNLDYVDLILLHAPSTGVHTGACNAAACAINKAQWQAYESIYKQGKAKAIGVSNYCQSCLECLMGGNTTVPAVRTMGTNYEVYSYSSFFRRKVPLWCARPLLCSCLTWTTTVGTLFPPSEPLTVRKRKRKRNLIHAI